MMHESVPVPDAAGMHIMPPSGLLSSSNAANFGGTANPCVARLDVLSEQLQQTSAHIETSVVGVCDNFSSIAVRARAETTRLQQLLEDGEQPSQSPSFEKLLKACNGTLLRLLETQTRNSVMIAEAIERLQGIDAAAVNISKALQQLDQIAHGNRLLALNARIEASHSPQHERGFTAVAIELAGQTERSKQVTGNVADLSSLLRQLAGSAVNDLESMQKDNSERTAQVRAEVDQTIEGLSGAYRTMREAVDRSQTESALLADEIGEAVRGMQFQDRVGQQIGHVVHDLRVMREHLAHSGGHAAAGEVSGFSNLVMREERAIRGVLGEESPEGDIELF